MKQFSSFLLSKVRSGLKEFGFQPVLGPSFANALFFKKSEGLVFTVGIQMSRHYTDRFTGSFYLSRSFHWSFIPLGFPRNAFERIGVFLSPKERQNLLDPIFWEEGVVDAWWFVSDDSASQSFLETVRLCEPRFLNQSGLRESIYKCDSLTRHVGLVSEIAALVKKTPSNLSLVGRKVPSDWYDAAEVVIKKKRPEYLKKQYITLLAVDAWRFSKYL